MTPPELPDTAALLAADVVSLELELATLRDECDLLRMMLSESMELTHQAVARLWRQTQGREA